MSLSSFTRRLRKSRTKSDRASSHPTDSDDGSKSVPSRSVSEPPPVPTVTAMESTVPTLRPVLQMPVPETSMIPMPMPMPTPEHVPSTPSGDPKTHPMDKALADLAPLQAQLDAGPSMRKVDRSLDAMGEKLINLDNKANMAMSVLNNAAFAVTALEQSDVVQKIERGIKRFADDIPWLMKGLDELARIHPAVTVAVLAFKAVYALETTRQENDRRVMTLYVEMKDMMMVMVQLKGVDNRSHVGLDGRVLKDRLEDLAEKTANNIKECANFCDTFLKKKLLVKVLKGLVWAEKLAAFVQMFTDRKADFQFALAMHTANSLADVKRQNYEIDAKLEIVIQLFNRFVSAEERKIAAEIESRGGTTKVRQDDETLRSLIAIEASMRSGIAAGGKVERRQGGGIAQPQGQRDRDKGIVEKGAAERTTGDKAVADRGPADKLGLPKKTKARSLTLDELKLELREDIDEALEENFDTFIGKFELQVSLVQVALERYIHEENDRVIGAVTDVMTQGPHMKIKDPELRKIWQEMGWRRNVKARLFVMTLQEHYRDAIDNAALGQGDEVVSSDQWALEFLGLAWLQPIMEAFDDDASGYVTISEVNKVMDMRPPSLLWSIPHWLAYWAIGWKIFASQYVDKIKELLSKMRVAIPRVHPRNRRAVDNYFNIWWWCAFLLLGMPEHGRPEAEFSTPPDRFQEYIDLEEQRIRGNLEKIKYDIDASDTLSLVLGSGRLEKSLFPLIYLLLQNDWRKLRAAQTVVLDEDEFQSSQNAFSQIIGAVERRVNQLKDFAIQQKLDPKAHVHNFAYGLYTHFGPDTEFWKAENSYHYFFNAYVYEEEEPLPSLEGLDLEKGSSFDTSLYDRVDDDTEEDLLALSPVKDILGNWNGFPYSNVLYPTRSMLSLHFHYSTKEGEDFTACGIEFDGDPFEISGTCEQDEDGVVQVRWTISYPGDMRIYYTGTLVDEYTIMGRRSYDNPDDFDWHFVLKKIPDEYMTFRPSPLQLQVPENKPRLLWQYAISVTLHEVRRRRFSWSYIAGRRDARMAYLRVQAGYGRPLPDFDERNARARQVCTAKDVRLYETFASYLSRIVPSHTENPCDYNMWGVHIIGGARYICIECEPDPTAFYEQVSFCDDPECLDQKVTFGESGEHKPTHTYVKVRTIVHRLQWPTVRTQARSAWEMVRDSYRGIPLPPKPPSETEDEEKGQLEFAQGARADEEPGLTVGTESEGKRVLDTGEDGEPTHMDVLAVAPQDAVAAPEVGNESVDEAVDEAVDARESAVEVSNGEAHAASSDQHPEVLEEVLHSPTAMLQVESGDSQQVQSRIGNPDAQEEGARDTDDASTSLAVAKTVLPTPEQPDMNHPSRQPAMGNEASSESVEKEEERKPADDDLSPTEDVDCQASGLLQHVDEKDTDGIDQSTASSHEDWPHLEDTLPNDDAVPPSPRDPGWYCKICQVQVYMGQCFFCLDCWDTICTECESRTLIICWSCKAPFPQREWYTGFSSNDFICNRCCGRGVKDVVDDSGKLAHVYTHPMITCKPSVPDDIVPPDEPPPDPSDSAVVQRRLEALEDSITAINEKFEAFQQQFSQLESRLESHLTKSQEAMQEIFFEKLTETLSVVLSKSSNGQAR